MPAEWGRQSSSTRVSGCGSSQQGLPGTMPSGCEDSERKPTDRPLSQARLDRIARPTRVYYDLFYRWLVKLLDNPQTYPLSEIKARLQEVVGPQVCRLRLLVMNPPTAMTAEAWENLEDELQRQYALMDAMVRVLEWRGGKGKPASWVVRKKSESAVPSVSTPNLDPFHDE